MESKSKDMITESCGVFLDVGSVIDAEDNVLDVPIQAADEKTAREQFAAILSRAQETYSETTGQAVWDSETKTLNSKLTFTCTAERLVFEMQMN